MTVRFQLLHPAFAAILLGVASAPLMLALADNGPKPGPQRAAHVELQNFQFKRVRAAMAMTEFANSPGPVPTQIHTAAPVEPGYIWHLTSDVPSAPSMLDQFDADPVKVAFFEPVQPHVPGQ